MKSLTISMPVVHADVIREIVKFCVDGMNNKKGLVTFITDPYQVELYAIDTDPFNAAPEFPHGEFDNSAHWQGNQDEHLRYDKPDIPDMPPLEPHTPCEMCGLQLAVMEIGIVDGNGAQLYTPMCFECYDKMEHDNGLEPGDSHYYPRS